MTDTSLFLSDITELMNQLDKIEAAVKRVRAGEFEAIKVQCYSKEEADHLKAHTDNLYPSINIMYLWLDFTF